MATTRDSDEETETPFTVESNEEKRLLPDSEEENNVVESVGPAGRANISKACCKSRF